MDKSDPDFFKEMRVAIFGMGLMGGSLALALKGKCARLIGIDPDPAAVRRAAETGVVDLAASEPASALPGADLIILAAPVRAIISLLNLLPTIHPAGAVVIDLGSTKSAILAAMVNLPGRFDPVGGHPICGKEKSGLAFADERLFADAAFVLTPLPRSSSRARKTAEQLARAVGARPLWMEAPEHDRLLASTSHLPFLAANALAASSDVDAAPLTGPGFESMTRLAGSSTEMMLDILITNRENVLSALKDFSSRLSRMEDLLAAGDFETLAVLLRDSAAQKEKIAALKGEML